MSKQAIKLAFTGLTVAALPLISSAAALPLTAPIQDVDTLKTRVVCSALQWFFTFAIILGVIFIIWAAYKYLTASGDPERVKSAHKTLIWGIVGLAVAIIAYGMPSIVSSLITPGGGTSAYLLCG
jgi:uncharacterized membrane protein YidH (DUF202 family)